MPVVDLIVIVVYILGIVIFGSFFLRRSRTLEGFTVGSRSLPGWALGLSILGTYLSSISFLAVPGKSYAGNWSFFVFSLSLPIACWVGSRYFIPLFRHGLQTTAYEHLETRFGYWARAYSALSLILLQIGRVGTVLYLVSIAMNELLNWNLYFLIVVLGVLTVIYTVLGGIEAVVWTDVVQAIVLLAGATGCIVLLLVRMPEGAGAAIQTAIEKDLFSFGGWDFNFIIGGFWVVFIFGIVDNLRNFGVDQNYVQRFLSAKSDREARKSLWLGGLLYVPVSALFFFIGTMLVLYYQGAPPADLPEKADQVFPFFIVSELPVGLTGLVIAAVLAAGMSTLDSSINVCATVFTLDFYRARFNKDATDRTLLGVTRVSTVIVGVLGIGASIWMTQAKSALDVWWQLSAVFGGGMLGIFLLGILVPRASSLAALVAVSAGVAAVAWGTYAAPFHKFMVGPLGLVVVLLVGWLMSKITRPTDGTFEKRS